MSCAALTLAFTAWGLGGVEAWSLHVLLAGGLLTLISAMMPLPKNSRFSFSKLKSPRKSLLGLLRWPAFWFSTLFILYLGLGAINPAFEIVSDDRGWWVDAINPPLGTALPTSVNSNYEPMNAWRVIVLFSASFALMWGLHAGLTRRSTCLIVLWFFVINGVGMGFVGVLQHLTQADKVLWTVESSNAQFWGSFFYRNQGAAYLNLTLIVCGVLYFYYARRAKRRGDVGGPHFLLFLFFALNAVSVGLALSRGGILFASILSLAVLSGVFLQFLQGSFAPGQSVAITAILAVLLSAGVFISYKSIDWEAIEKRFGEVSQLIESAESDTRTLSSRATWDMAQGRLLTGWGAGSFRYIFPMYQQQYPEIFYGRYDRKREEWVGRKFYRYGHNDLLQFLAEYGLIGCSLLLVVIATLVLQLIASIKVGVFSILYLMLGLITVFAHAFIDFIFNSPAYWIALIAILTILSRLFSLEKNIYSTAPSKPNSLSQDRLKLPSEQL